MALPDPSDAAEIAKKFGFTSPQMEQLRRKTQQQESAQVVPPAADQTNPVVAQPGSYRLSEGSVGSLVANSNGPAPLQGYDVGVWVTDLGYNGRASRAVLLGQFNNIVITVRNVSDPYMAVGYRQPLYLDGEVQIAFTLEKGLLDIDVFTETFGFDRFDRDRRFNRTPRFDITFALDPVDWNALSETSMEFNEPVTRKPTGRFVLGSCKIESFHLGASAGKNVVATQWHGIAHSIRAIRSNLTQQEDLVQKSSVFNAYSGNRDDQNLPAAYQGFNVTAITNTSKDFKPQSTSTDSVFSAGATTLLNLLTALRSLKIALPNDPTVDQSIEQVNQLLNNLGATKSQESFDREAMPKTLAPKSEEPVNPAALPKTLAPKSEPDPTTYDNNKIVPKLTAPVSTDTPANPKSVVPLPSTDEALARTYSNLSARLNQLNVQLAGETDVLARRRLQATIQELRNTLTAVEAGRSVALTESAAPDLRGIVQD